mmetsp:Transcript_4939/g.18368  ORF Transcript_4939/g.18368 Transcript_4939/m.18368 type:complete len:83 (-) Transcript_4939:26-274(-)
MCLSFFLIAVSTAARHAGEAMAVGDILFFCRSRRDAARKTDDVVDTAESSFRGRVTVDLCESHHTARRVGYAREERGTRVTR